MPTRKRHTRTRPATAARSNAPSTIPFRPTGGTPSSASRSSPVSAATCAQTPTGLTVYGNDGNEELDLPAGPGYNRRYCSIEVDEMCRAIREDTPVRIHDAYWGKATQEVVLGIIQSSDERREVFMQHQVPYTGQGVA